MKIVIMNDLLLQGGTEIQCLREKEIFESKGHEVYLLTFDKGFPKAHELYNKSNNFYNLPIAKRHRGVFTNKKLLSDIRNILSELQPDVIHVNNFNLAPFTQYKALHGYKAVQTLRDYSAVCMKMTCLHDNLTVCKGFASDGSPSCCSNNLSTLDIKNKFKLSKFLRIVAMKKKYIYKFITPSVMLRKYCEKNSYNNVITINDCFDFSNLKDFSKGLRLDIKQYVYFGNISEVKGIFKFLDAFKEFSRDKAVELLIAGGGDQYNIDKLNKIIYENSKIKYLGYLEYKEVLKVLESTYAVVVPSILMDNYPNTVLEAMATQCIVLGSSRGGIPEMLDERGFIFDILNQQSINNALEMSFNISDLEYNKLISLCQQYIKKNNNIDTYYNKLIEAFTKV